MNRLLFIMNAEETLMIIRSESFLTSCKKDSVYLTSSPFVNIFSCASCFFSSASRPFIYIEQFKLLLSH